MDDVKCFSAYISKCQKSFNITRILVEHLPTIIDRYKKQQKRTEIDVRQSTKCGHAAKRYFASARKANKIRAFFQLLEGSHLFFCFTEYHSQLLYTKKN